MKKLLLPILTLGLLTFSLQSCKEKCDNCAANESCVDGECVPNDTENVVISSNITENQTWTADKIYQLSGRIFVTNGATLTIEPGTIIKAEDGTQDDISSLIIAKGAKINAVGDANNPIIFTSIYDNITIGEKFGTNLSLTDGGLWGGLIVLGDAPISAGDGDNVSQFEAIPATESLGTYGGSNSSDNSGKIKFVSIRYSGVAYSPDAELQGLTLCGVGSATEISDIEIAASKDDGIEFFGGTVDVSNVVVLYQGDDGLDVDQNYSGTISNSVVIMGNGVGTDEALEIDGPEGSTYTSGLFTIENSSFWTEGTDGYAGDFKSKAQGTVQNCTFEGFINPIKIAAKFSDTTACTGPSDAYNNLITNGTLVFSNNQFKTNSSLTDLSSYVNAYISSCDACGCEDQAAVDAEISGGGNTANASVSGGANTSVFGWTWAAELGKL